MNAHSTAIESANVVSVTHLRNKILAVGRAISKRSCVTMRNPNTRQMMTEFTYNNAADYHIWMKDNPTATAWTGNLELCPEPAYPVPAPQAPEPEVAPTPKPTPKKHDFELATAPEGVPEPEADAVADVETRPIGGDVTERSPDSGEERDDGDGTAQNPISIEKRPCYRVFEKSTYVVEHERLKPGVYFFGTKAKGNEIINTCEWICSPLHIDAIASDEQDGSYGRVIRFINPKKKWRTWAMPMEMLAGSGEDLRAELLAMGAIINPDAKHRLLKYLTEDKTKLHVRCATQVGWCNSSFVLPGAVIGPDAAKVVFQSGERSQAEYGQRGTLDGWKQHVAARAVGNPVLMMALSAAFVGPLLERVGGESGGVHLVDNSSVGKSTAIKATASVWGGTKHVRSWNATANGMEGVAAMFNDNLLPLDEISECTPHDVNRIIYALGNGVGRQRANRSGAARSVVRWKCFIISSGERMISTELLNAGINAKAGQLVRVIDLPVGRQHGVWDDVQELPNGGAFSNAIKSAVADHHGKAGPAFLERLTRDGRKWSEQLQRITQAKEFSVAADSGQDQRVAARFALIAMAGELATEFGITGWEAGAATMAAAEMFRTWQRQRKHGNKEPGQIIEQLAAFIERHGDSRFSENRGGDAVPVVRDRAGWWERGYEGEGRIYWFNSAGLREALKGFDFERALDVLVAAGAMPQPKGDGRRAQQKKIDGQNLRLYQISSDRLVG